MSRELGASRQRSGDLQRRAEKELRRWLRRQGVPTRMPGRRSERDRDTEAAAAQVMLACGFETDELFRVLGECGWPAPANKVDRSRHLQSLRTRWESLAESLPATAWLPQPPTSADKRRLTTQRRAARLPLDHARLDGLYAASLSRLRSYDLPGAVLDRLWMSDSARRGFVRTLLAYRALRA